MLGSSAASSLGATSGLLWMMQLLIREKNVPAPGLVFSRRWAWIALGAIVTVLYTAILGPTSLSAIFALLVVHIYRQASR